MFRIEWQPQVNEDLRVICKVSSSAPPLLFVELCYFIDVYSMGREGALDAPVGKVINFN